MKKAVLLRGQDAVVDAEIGKIAALKAKVEAVVASCKQQLNDVKDATKEEATSAWNAIEARLKETGLVGKDDDVVVSWQDDTGVLCVEPVEEAKKGKIDLSSILEGLIN